MQKEKIKKILVLIASLLVCALMLAVAGVPAYEMATGMSNYVETQSPK